MITDMPKLKGGGLGRYHPKDYYKCECGETFRTQVNFSNHKKKCEKKDGQKKDSR